MTEQDNPLQKEVGKSAGGSVIYEYQDLPDKGFRPPTAYGVYAEAVDKHFQELFPNRESMVYHEIMSDLVHIDVTIMKPTEEKPFYVVYTTGMSDLPMTLPEQIREEHKNLERAELFMLLPKSWLPGAEYTISANMPYEQYWPIQTLKYLARFPHEYHTWLGWGHTIPNGPDYEPFLDGCGMGAFLLLELDENFSPLKTADGTPVHIYMVQPAYREEVEYKLEHGMNALDGIFAAQNLPLVVDLYRPNYCRKD